MLLKPFLLLLAVCFILSCSVDMRFDKLRWSKREDVHFPPSARSSMLKDLLENHKLIGLTCMQLEAMLGSADYRDSTIISYRIKLDFDGIDPSYTENLEFTFTADSIVKEFKVVEWQKQ